MSQTIFKLFFFSALMVFCVLIVGVFLVFVKIGLLFYPDISIMGVSFAQEISAAY